MTNMIKKTTTEQRGRRSGMTFDEMLAAFDAGYGIASVEDMLELAGVDPKEIFED